MSDSLLVWPSEREGKHLTDEQGTNKVNGRRDEGNVLNRTSRKK